MKRSRQANADPKGKSGGKKQVAILGY